VARMVLAVPGGSTALVDWGAGARNKRWKATADMLIFAGIAGGYIVLAVSIGVGLRPVARNL